MRKQVGMLASLLFLSVSTLLWTGCANRNRCCKPCEPICEPCRPVCPAPACRPVCPPQPCKPVCVEPCRPVCPAPACRPICAPQACKPVCAEPCKPVRPSCVGPQANQEFFQVDGPSSCEGASSFDSMPYDNGFSPYQQPQFRQGEGFQGNAQFYQMNAGQEFSYPAQQFDNRPQFSGRPGQPMGAPGAAEIQGDNQ